jgi:hypothetical protein
MARRVSQRMSLVLRKSMGVDRPTLWALLWHPAAALQRLTRTMAIACVLCLVAEHHSNAEPVNITLTEY